MHDINVMYARNHTTTSLVWSVINDATRVSLISLPLPHHEGLIKCKLVDY